MRKTHATVAVVAALLEKPDTRRWGREIGQRAGLHSGALYPILHRMLDAGWITDAWENQSETGGNRPPRRYYEVTGHGQDALGAMLREARRDARFVWLLGHSSSISSQPSS